MNIELLKKAAAKMAEVLQLSDPEGRRAKGIVAPEDAEIKYLCERIGYGAVMDSAARQWRRKDPIGAHTTGGSALTVKEALRLYREAVTTFSKETK